MPPARVTELGQPTASGRCRWAPSHSVQRSHQRQTTGVRVPALRRHSFLTAARRSHKQTPREVGIAFQQSTELRHVPNPANAGPAQPNSSIQHLSNPTQPSAAAAILPKRRVMIWVFIPKSPVPCPGFIELNYHPETGLAGGSMDHKALTDALRSQVTDKPCEFSATEGNSPKPEEIPGGVRLGVTALLTAAAPQTQLRAAQAEALPAGRGAGVSCSAACCTLISTN